MLSAMEEWRVFDGVPLSTELESSGPLTAARAVALIAQIAVELDGMAADGGLRSDIVDPVNILVGTDGSVLLAGPGTALEANVAYLAPERVARTGAVSAATDVYALACVLYECLTGRPPHADGEEAVAENIDASIPPGFDAVLVRGLAADPGDRFPSAGAFAVAARKALRESEPDSAPLMLLPPPVQQNYPQLPGLSEYARAVLANPQITLPPATGYRSVTEKPRPVGMGTRLLPAAVVAAVLLLAGVSILVAHSVAGVEGTATGPKSVDDQLAFRSVKIATDRVGSVYIAGEEWAELRYGIWKFAPDSREPMKLPFPDDVFAAGLAVDQEGRVYVTTSRGDVAVLAPDTGEVRSYTVPDQGNLGNIAVDGSGNVFGVGGRGSVWWVWALNTGTGAVNRLPFPESGAEYHVAVGPSGEVYAASGCKAVDGKFLHTDWIWKLEVGASQPVKIPLALRCPKLLAADSAGNLYVLNSDAPPTLRMVPKGWTDSLTLPMRHLPDTYALSVGQAGHVYGVSVGAGSQTATLEKLTIEP